MERSRGPDRKNSTSLASRGMAMAAGVPERKPRSWPPPWICASSRTRGFLRTNNFDTNSRLCMASAAVGYTRSFGADGPPCSYEDIDAADCFVLIGANVADCHPVLFKRLRRRNRPRRSRPRQHRR